MSEVIDVEQVPQPGTEVAQVRQTGIVKPMATEAELRAAFAAFSSLKFGIVKDVNGLMKMGDKDYVKKEGWVAIKAAFRLNTQVVREGWRELPGGVRQFVCVVRATAPNGDFAEAVGVCDTQEDFYKKGTRLGANESVPEGVETSMVRGRDGWNRFIPKPLSAVAGFAQTRATNRAISTLCGGGENSAEEMTGADEGAVGGTPAVAKTGAGSGFSGVNVPFGKHKGEPVEDQAEKELNYLLEYAEGAAKDPKKAKFRHSNEVLRDACRAELTRRKAAASAPATPAPAPAPVPAAAPKPAPAAECPVHGEFTNCPEDCNSIPF